MFVAVAIGYGVEEERSRPLPLKIAQGKTAIPGNIALAAIPTPALIEGIRINPRLDSLVFRKTIDPGGVADRLIDFSNEPITADIADQIFQRVKAPREVSFLFSIVDSGTGRELQDEPQYNLASLGKSNGERPFRLLTQPLSFLPRSTIRMQIEERTPDVQGTLFVVLFGYKVLHGSACTESQAKAYAQRMASAGSVRSRPQEGLIPFDYVTKFTLTGRPGTQLEDEVTISGEGAFVASAIGYGLSVDDEPVMNLPAGQEDVVLSQLTLRNISLSAVSEGFRIRPDYIRLVLGSGAGLKKVKRLIAEEAFERLNQPEDVSFRYTIYDTGIGRDWQNQPIHNIAGLGIANGQRPFKKLARPRVFEPRSTLRIMVEERFGRGTLFIVLQGYKTAPSLKIGARR
jgi:hypothetical protein